VSESSNSNEYLRHFVTCFASYLGKSREISDFGPFTLYLSYFTQGIELKTLSKEEKQRKSTKAYSPWRVIGEERRVRGELRQ